MLLNRWFNGEIVGDTESNVVFKKRKHLGTEPEITDSITTVIEIVNGGAPSYLKFHRMMDKNISIAQYEYIKERALAWTKP